jgi:hypothetical protein
MYIFFFLYSKLVEIDGEVLKVSQENLDKIFPMKTFAGIKVTGKRKYDEIQEM